MQHANSRVSQCIFNNQYTICFQKYLFFPLVAIGLVNLNASTEAKITPEHSKKCK